MHDGWHASRPHARTCHVGNDALHERLNPTTLIPFGHPLRYWFAHAIVVVVVGGRGRDNATHWPSSFFYVALGGQSHPLFASAAEKSVGISRRALYRHRSCRRCRVMQLCNDLSRMLTAARTDCRRWKVKHSSRGSRESGEGKESRAIDASVTFCIAWSSLASELFTRPLSRVIIELLEISRTRTRASCFFLFFLYSQSVGRLVGRWKKPHCDAATPLRLSIEGEGIFVKGGWKKELATRGGSEIRSALNSDTARRVVVNFRHECATLVLQVSVHT